jgi:hypothetical protein
MMQLDLPLFLFRYVLAHLGLWYSAPRAFRSSPLLVKSAHRFHHVSGVDCLDAASLCRECPNTPRRIFKQAIFLQVSPGPRQSITYLGLVAFLWIVHLREDVLWNLLEFHHLLIDLIDRTGAPELAKRRNQRIHQ